MGKQTLRAGTVPAREAMPAWGVIVKFGIDYQAVFRELPVPVALLTPDFVLADMNEAYLKVSGRKREELLGSNIFAAFPDNPADPRATGTRNLRASLQRVLDTGLADTMALQKYDVEDPAMPGTFVQRFWCPANAPIFAADGRVALIAHYVEEVTDRIRKFVARQEDLRRGESIRGPGYGN